MKGSMTAAAVHKQYSEGISAFRRQIGDAALRSRFTSEVDGFLRACAIGVWGRDGGALTPRHVEYYNAIYSAGNPVPSILFWELSTAVLEYPGFRPPDFFARMRACDKVGGGKLSRRFSDLVTLMLLLFAAVDDVVSEEEAGFVNLCADSLGALCARDGLRGEKAPLDVSDFVTKRPDADAAAPREEGGAQPEAAAKVPAAPAPSLEELLAELDALCGLEK
ncbi:MAG: type VII secretion protein, partial [Pseudoflavonifractor sp.]